MSAYPDQYDPSLLQAVPRATLRISANVEVEAEVEVSAAPASPMFGVDYWHAYDLSWLNAAGKPEVAVMRVSIGANSQALPESKSFKLYLNSFANTNMASWDDLRQCVTDDLSKLLQSKVDVELFNLTDWATGGGAVAALPGINIDEQDLKAADYSYDPNLLRLRGGGGELSEQVHSHLLRTLCPITGQPDWASLLISYSGAALCHQGLLRYIVAYRCFAGFHEQVVEQVYQDILRCCQPASLAVYACFQRRGGLDINPYRATQEAPFEPLRTARQ